MRRTSESSDPTQGIDIMLVLDRSSSMRAEDMATAEGGRVSRMSAAIAAATGFVQSRRDDRVGLVVFARFPVTRSPLTVDGRLLREILGDIEPVGPGSIEDRTSIGDAIALACARLKETRAGGKAIVLASDGRNNAGRVSPDDAIALAKSLGIRIYAIGIGSPDTRSGSALDFLASTPTLDEDSLHRITETTGGRYFRAGDVRSLESAHKEINAIEKSPDGRTNLAEYAGLAPVFSSAALGVLAAWIALHAFFVRRLP
ncbi:MAG TPA: VWA domain-containing protein [Candidatus Brocadiia bacterium]|nr:VWA domain-containing protein [Candidatus Brocadiia bacterium]